MMKIVVYNYLYQEGIDAMMKEISSEFDESIFSKSTNDMPVTLNGYWLALNNFEVIGTIGVVQRSQFGILKKMMVKRAFRGKEFGVSNLLLQTATEWCVKNNISRIFLGTMNQFKAAQSFYEKNGFKQISESELPENFVNNPLDKVFFKLDLSN